MFSALSQGSLIHILDKTNGLKYRIGEVIGVTQPNQFGGTFSTSSFNNPLAPIVIKVKVDGNVQEYPDVPSANTMFTYNNGNIVISETTQGIQTEVESIHKRNTQIIADDNINKLKKEIEDCELIMKDLNPQFAQDKARDERIDSLDNKVSSIENKLDKILNAVSNTQPKIKP